MIAMDDFETFKKLMCKRNMELELEAIRTYSSSTHRPPKKGMNSNYKELNEDRRLEQALAESLQMSNMNAKSNNLEGEEKDGKTEKEIQEILKNSLLDIEMMNIEAELEQVSFVFYQFCYVFVMLFLLVIYLLLF
jgi:hypothetical protein